MIRNRWRYAQPAAAIIGLWACAGLLGVAQAGAPAAEDTLEYHVLAAEMAGQRGNSQVAAREYLAAARLSHDPELAERATRVALYAEEDNLALQAVEIWTALAPDNVDAQEIGVRLALEAGKLDEARDFAQGYVDLHPQGAAVAFRQLGRIVGSSKTSAENGIGILRDLAKVYPQLPEADYAVGLVSLRNNQPAQAITALDKALAERPGWNDAIVLKASALIRLNRLDDARQTLAGASGGKQEKAAVHLIFGRLLLEAGKDKPAQAQFRQVLDMLPAQPDALHALGLMALQDGQLDSAYGYLQKLYDADPSRRDETAFYLGTIDEQQGHYEKAALWYARVLGGGYEFQAVQHHAYVLSKLGQLKRAREILEQYGSKYPDKAAQVYLSEAGLLYQAGAYQQAAEVYNKAVTAFPNEPELIYGRALVSERLGRIASAEQDLRHLLSLNPNDARTLNALGYVLATHSQRYDEARGYIDQAYQQHPDDPAINDSLGWVIYKQGDPEQALPYLRRAYKAMPDPEIAAHLGEVLWASGEHAQAQAIWRQGLSKDPDQPVLNATIRRLLR